MGSGGSKRTSDGDSAGAKKNKAKKGGKTAPEAVPGDTANGGAAGNVESGKTAGENGTTAGTAAATPPAVTLRPKNALVENAASRRTSFYETVDAAEILPHLVMGNLASAKNAGFLRGKHVMLVLDLTTEGEGRAAAAGPFLREMGIERLHVEIEDDEDEEISGHFDTCFEFINKAKMRGTAETGKKRHHSSSGVLQHKTVLVHSNYGLSRTSAIVLAYLMREKQWSLRESQEHLRRCHAVAKPNDGFVVQLLRYEQELRGSMSMTLHDFYKH